ncbi:MAG: DUF3536 domain-containing protein [Calditrichaeota bacterium]|nr:DUF3536 domain-containing protein [Calditrichota bacterium]RQW05708.1 MAG: DUF3536 domain-containing protein [Calditrichota bacterium]
MKQYICIHGHFYQPPRENAWLEEIEIQDSAYPYHDWNERVTAECYAPNAASRILDGESRIVDIVNNYSRISFNFGPTLLTWLEKHDSETYEAILEADRKSQEHFSGHGSAIAQVYNHMIMPLANRRDKKTQVLWGIRDFTHRFGRDPEGMWLPETAVDIPTLETLAEFGISFTILAPHQAKQIRKIGDQDWQDVQGGKVNPRRAYLCNLPSGKSINLFFYDGPISQELGFGDLLRSGESFANRLTGAFSEDEKIQLIHIATDGETYGHHRNHGDMALAYSLYFIDTNHPARLTNYGENLEKYPPRYEAEIIENSSWSCVHGVERWKSDCGCNTGMNPGWNQKWREPLRDSLDALREKLAVIFREKAGQYLENPWKTRDEYIEVILDRSEENTSRFLSGFAGNNIELQDKIILLKCLEMQRNAMLMYTSCGWFFDEISGIETTQVMQYAGRAMQLAQEITGEDLEPAFIDGLQNAPSNLPQFSSGAEVYQKYIQPSRIDLVRVAAHYAISSVFEDYPKSVNIFCFEFERETFEKIRAGHIQLATGRASVKSKITWNEISFSFAVLYLGGHMIHAGVRKFLEADAFNNMQKKLAEVFRKSDIPEVIRIMDSHFESRRFSLWHLFRDEQRKVFNQILESSLKEIEFHFRDIYKSDYVLIQAMENMQVPVPAAISTPVEFILNRDLQKLLESDEIDPAALDTLVSEFNQLSIEPDRKTLNFLATQKITDLLHQLQTLPLESEPIVHVREIIDKLEQLNLQCDYWEAQNTFFLMLRKTYPEMKKKADSGDEKAQEWIESFKRLGTSLKVKVD